MAWTTPRCWVTGEVVTAALLNAQIKGNMDLTAPAKLTAAGDMLYATGANATARLAKGTNGNIMHQASCAPAWTASPSITAITLSGALDANGTVDADVTDFDVLSSGDIDLVSSANAAAAVYIAQSTGTSGTVKIHADTGTSVTEGAESINILSDAGGVGIRSTANLAKAINITSDGGTTGSIAIFNDQGTSVTEGSASISLLSDAGGVELRSTANLANAINITNDGGTTGTISIFNDQGSSVTEGAESISLLSDAGGVGIRSTANLANAVNITADGGTTSTIQIFNDQGTAVNEGVASIQLLSDVGGIGIKSGLNAAGAIRLTADAGTSETIVLHADQGSGTGSICLTSDAGGITLNPGTFVSVGGIADGEIRIFEDTGAGCNYAAIKVQNMSASYTLTLPADDGCCGEVLTTNGSGTLTWEAAGGGISGLGSTDNAILRANGTGGATAQGSSATIDDCGKVTFVHQILADCSCSGAANPSLSFRGEADTGIYKISHDTLGFAAGGSEIIRFDMAGGATRVGVGDNDPGNGTVLLRVCQGANDDDIMSFGSSDVAHGMTTEVHTDTFGVFKKRSATTGGQEIRGYGESEEGLYLSGRVVSTDTTKNTSADAPLALDARLKSGSGTDEVASNGNLVTIKTTDTTRFIFDKEGSGHADIEFTTYDDYNDIELMRGVHGALVPCFTKQFGRDMVYNICQYQEMGLIGRCSVHWENHDDGTPQLRGMVNMTKLSMLHHSTIIQLADNLNARIDGIETQLKVLTEGK